MVFSRPVNNDLFHEAMAAYEQNEYVTAFKLIRTLALGGDATAQCLLGFMYYQGEGTEKNLYKAYKWLNSSAMQGFSEARSARDLVGDLILKTGSSTDIANMKLIFKNSIINRRTGVDRRQTDHRQYLDAGGTERRSFTERRKAHERRSPPRSELGG